MASSILLRIMGVARGDRSKGNLKKGKKKINCLSKAGQIYLMMYYNITGCDNKNLFNVILSCLFEVMVKWTCEFIKKTNLLAVLQKASRGRGLVCKVVTKILKG